MALYLEGAMLAAFSVSWYCSIWKMLRTGHVSGKSLCFVLLICFGYLCGIGSKYMLWSETGTMPRIILLYGWNLIVTGFDAWLVYRLGSWRAASPGARGPRAANDPASAGQPSAVPAEPRAVLAKG